jgi:hypothetical protein
VASPADRFIAYYSLADANDAHTGGHNLTAVNGPTHVTGRVGNGAEFDVTAQSGYIISNAGAGAFKPGTDSISVAFWVKILTLPSSGNAGALIHMGATSAADHGWHVIFNNSGGSGQFIARFSDGTTLYTATTGTGYVVDTWYHVAAVWDRKAHLRLYINGVQQANVSIAASSSANVQPTQDFKIGGRHSTSVWFDGIIDEVLIYGGVISSDIRAIHRNGTSGNSFATIAATSRPFVSQEFVHEQESNTTHAETPFTGLTAGHAVVAMLVTDGNTTSPAVAAWDGAWTLAIDGGTPNGGSQLVRTRVYWKIATATDVSTETEVRIDWTTNEKAVLITQFWENCVGMNAANESDTAAAASSYTENGVTTTVDGCQIVMGIGIDGGTVVNSVSPAIPFNEYQVTNSAGHCGIWFGSETKATAGATGSYTITMSASVNAVPFSFAMEPIVTSENIDLGYTTSAGASYSLSVEEVALDIPLGFTASAGASYSLTVEEAAGAENINLGFTSSASASYALEMAEEALSISLGFTASAGTSYALEVTEEAASIVLGFTSSASVSYPLSFILGEPPEEILLGFTASAGVSYAWKRIVTTRITPGCKPQPCGDLVVPVDACRTLVYTPYKNLCETVGEAPVITALPNDLYGISSTSTGSATTTKYIWKTTRDVATEGSWTISVVATTEAPLNFRFMRADVYPDAEYIFTGILNSDTGLYQIRRYDADGTNPIDIITGLTLMTGMAIDRTNKRLFYALDLSDDEGALYSCEYDGTDIVEVVTLPTQKILGPAYHDGFVYYMAEGGGVEEFRKVNTTTLADELIFEWVSSQFGPDCTAHCDGTYYVNDSQNDADLIVVPVADPASSWVNQGVTSGAGVACDFQAGHIFFCEGGTTTKDIWRTTFDEPIDFFVPASKMADIDNTAPGTNWSMDTGLGL